MKHHTPFVVATILCSPFLFVVVGFLIALLFVLLAPDSIRDPIELLMIYAYLLFLALPVAVVAPILALVLASVIAAWLQKRKTKFELIIISIYSVVMLLYVGFELWFHVTGQEATM